MPSPPFVVGQWVRAEKFYGRASLIEEILEGSRNWVWLLGTRRIGKTSLLKQLEYMTSSARESRYFPIFWDFQGADDPSELHRGFQDALLDAEERLMIKGIKPTELEGADLFESLGRLRRNLRARNLRLLLLCDEVEELIKLHQKDPGMLRKLRRAMQSQEDIRSVLASTIRLWALADQTGDTSPFLHGFTPPLYIQRLEDEEARTLVGQTKLPNDSQPRFDERVVDEIIQRCDNHPYLIQIVCKRYMEAGDLNEAIDQVASDQMVSYFFSVDFAMLSRGEQDVIRIISESSSATSDSILDRLAVEPGELSGTLFRLQHLGYLRRNAERRFELVNHFFRKWFRNQPRSSPGHALDAAAAPTVVGADSERTTHPLQDGSELFDGRYRLQQELGKGAVGVVYKARDEVAGETIAVKILKPEYGSHAEILERFRREILLARDLSHPNIVKIYHLGDCRGRKYLLMRWVDGPTLANLIAREGALATTRIVETSRKLASALEAVHALHVVHRDVKPQNVLVDAGGEPYLTDFGLARLKNDPAMTQSGIFLGTPTYASPEQARLMPTDERADIYSLGVVMFEMATGREPFSADSPRRVLEMHRDFPPPDPASLRPGISAELSRLILWCLEKEPARRPPSARVLRLALEGLHER